VEKPLSHTIEGVNELISSWKESKIVGLIGYCLRYDPAARCFRQLLAEEALGRILHVRVECGSWLPDWRPGRDYRESVSAKKELGGGVLLELSHELDYIRWFFGDMENVDAILHNSSVLGLDVEENSELLLTSRAGYPISVHLDFNSHFARRSCVVRCSKGDLEWNVLEKSVIQRPIDSEEQIIEFDHDRDEMYRLQLQHFFDCIENGPVPEVDLQEGVEVLRLVEAARKSDATGKRVTLT
jgi:predicted dehydrogenase